MDLKEAIKKKFIRKLVNLNIWEGKHTELKNLQKSLPDHLVSLNSHKQKEIYEFLGNFDERLK